MPVPEYSEPQVAPAPLPGARMPVEAPIEAFGGGQDVAPAGQAAQTFGQLEQIARREQHRADQLAVLDADRQLSDHETELLWNQKTGALNQRGRNAFGVLDPVQQSFRQKVSELQGKLTNDYQRVAFGRMAFSRGAELHRAVERHIAQESRAFDDETTKAYIQNEQDAAAMNYGDPERVAMALERQKAAIIDYAGRNGIPDERMKSEILRATSLTQTGVVNRMLAAGLDRAAKIYYDENKDDFQAHDAVRLEAALQEGSYRGESQRIVDGYFNPDFIGQGAAESVENMDQVRERAQAIDDPKLRDLVIERAKERFTEHKQAIAEDQRKRFDAAARIIEGDPSRLARDAVAPDDWTRMTFEEHRALENYQAMLVKREEPASGGEVFYRLRDLAKDPATRADFIHQNLMLYRARLSTPDFKELTNLQFSLQEKSEEAQSKLDNWSQVDEAVKTAIEPTDLGAKTGNEVDRKALQGRIAAFRSAVDTEVRNYRASYGRMPDREALQKITDGLLTQTQAKGWFQKGQYAFEAAPPQAGGQGLTWIPAAERLQIEQALRRRGLPVTDDAVTSLYVQKRMEDERARR